MNVTDIVIDLPGGYEAKLLFRQYQPGGDWICQASDEYIADLSALLKGEFEPDCVQ